MRFNHFMLLITFQFIGFLHVVSQSADVKFQKRIQETADEILYGVQSSRGTNLYLPSYILCGFTTSVGQGNRDALLIKLGHFGDTLFMKTYGAGLGEWFTDVDTCSDGGYIMAGTTSSATSRDFFIVRTNSVGDTLWTGIFGGAMREEAMGVVQTSDQGFLAVGQTDSWGAGLMDMYVVKLDKFGKMQWGKTYGGAKDDIANSVMELPGGGYVVLGETESYGAGAKDVYMLRLNNQGDTVWTKTFGTTAVEDGKNMVVRNGNIYLVGNTTPAPGGNKDALLLRCDLQGKLKSAFALGTDSIDVARSIGYSKNEMFTIGGYTLIEGKSDAEGFAFIVDTLGQVHSAKHYGSGQNDYFYDGAMGVYSEAIFVGRTDGFNAMSGDGYVVKTDSGLYSTCNEVLMTIKSTKANITQSNGAIISINLNRKRMPFGVVDQVLGDSVLCYESWVGINNESMDNGFNVSPNPASGKVTISLSQEFGASSGVVTLFNLYGEKVLQKTTNQSITHLDLSRLQEGVYLLNVRFNNGDSSTEKLVVMKK